MNIVIIITRMDEIGGAQTHVRDVAIELVKDGNKVTLLCGYTGDLSKQLESKGVVVLRIESLVREISLYSDLKAYLDIKESIKNISPDLIALHSSKAGLLGRLAASSQKIPSVFTAHGWSFADGVPKVKKFIYKNIEKIAASYGDRIINVSECDRRLALKYKVGRESSHVTIHNGIKDLAVQSKRRKKKCDVIMLVMVARFCDQKDHDTLLRALSEIKNLSWNLMLVGGGERESEVRALSDSLGLSSRVEFMGVCENVSDILSRSDVFVLTSHWEGLPISIVEAMRVGLPVVASDVGGVEEQLKEKLSWGLVKRGDVGDLKSKLELLIEDDELRCQLGEESREVFFDGFRFEKMYRDICGVYRELVSN
ncbi:glycosyltransferase family 4 protein [Parendozoicomonas sp. Alg238-R29]|uniref:glycosyltransferase family 4 protein n=1 Tax=Parendozoicomonas sp. Alg238-R29 TaxID=2993446 RepID=UPI00248D6AAA|nr:glycosyltransferase family 4 protein [Parendozoicomonas sp. Alg238-R29]